MIQAPEQHAEIGQDAEGLGVGFLSLLLLVVMRLLLLLVLLVVVMVRMRG